MIRAVDKHWGRSHRIDRVDEAEKGRFIGDPMLFIGDPYPIDPHTGKILQPEMGPFQHHSQ